MALIAFRPPIRWCFSESTESNKKFTLSVLWVSAVNYYEFQTYLART